MLISAQRILVVDDDEDSVAALALLLRHAGHEVREAKSVEAAFRLAVTDPPEVLVSDLNLTDGDGCDLLRRLRTLHPHVRGIAVSGYTGEQYERQCRDAGYEAMLSKPLVFPTLLAAIEPRPPAASPPGALKAGTLPAGGLPP